MRRSLNTSQHQWELRWFTLAEAALVVDEGDLKTLLPRLNGPEA
jgi:hypothetical protein